jgi:hypothetical protein
MAAGCAAPHASLIFLELVVAANHCTSEQQDVVASFSPGDPELDRREQLVEEQKGAGHLY